MDADQRRKAAKTSAFIGVYRRFPTWSQLPQFGQQFPGDEPDAGRYLAYSIDDIGQNSVSQNQRVFVRSFPDPDRLYIQAVEERADDPFWSLDGKYLYYRSSGELMRIEVDTGDVFRPLSAPETVIVFPAITIRTAVNPNDGRLLIVHPGTALQASSQTKVDVILSFSRYLDEMFGTDD